LSVSLPKDWVKRVGLKRGDLIYLDSSDDELRLVPRPVSSRVNDDNAVEIMSDQCTTPDMLSRILVSNYYLGHSILKVSSKNRLDSASLARIRTTVRRLMGTAIIEESPNHVTLQSSIDVTRFPMPTLVQRLYSIASTMYREAVEAFLTSTTDLAEESLRRQEEADIIFRMIVRLLDSAQRNQSLLERIDLETPLDILWYRTVVQCLWRATSWSGNISREVIELKAHQGIFSQPLSTAIQDLNEQANDVMLKGINSFFSTSLTQANEAIEAYEQLQVNEGQLKDSLDALIDRTILSKPRLVARLSFIVYAIRRTAEIGSEIAEVAITKTLSKPTNICRPTTV
jgi:phosphate uptake regulator